MLICHKLFILFHFWAPQFGTTYNRLILKLCAVLSVNGIYECMSGTGNLFLVPLEEKKKKSLLQVSQQCVLSFPLCFADLRPA